MINALKNVAAQIDLLLKQDDFQQGIVPAFLRDAVIDYPLRGGKRLRPAMVLWSCGIFGGNEESAIFPAAACEVFHNWTLVHDDIIDNDATRRGVPTCHKQLELVAAKEFNSCNEKQQLFGRDFAILCGDLQQGWANSLMLKSTINGVSPQLAVTLSRKMQEFASKFLICGEALDVAMSYRALSTISPTEIERMFELKTGVLFQFCCETGAMIALNDASGKNREISIIGKMAMDAAVAFQMRDDYLGIFGDAEKFGKPIGSDLSERKATMLLLSALNNLPECGKNELLAMLGKTSYTGEELDKVRNFYSDSGALNLVSSRAGELASSARENLNLLPDNHYRTLFSQLLSYLLDREI